MFLEHLAADVASSKFYYFYGTGEFVKNILPRTA
jgi:hypothetical protein